MKAQHTPFRQTRGGYEIKSGINLIAICTEKEHAALIVRAVNSHDTLVRLLEQALSELLGKSASTGDEFIEEVERELVKAKK